MERWQASLNEKAAIEAEAKAAALEAAKADLESHVVERAANKEAKMGRNREQEQVRKEGHSVFVCTHGELQQHVATGGRC